MDSFYQITKYINLDTRVDMRNYEFSAPTVNNNNLLEFPTFETDEDNMACLKPELIEKPHQGSNECKTFNNASSFSQSKELCYSQATSYNKLSNLNEYKADSTVTDSCGVIDAENKCSKPRCENNPMDKLPFMQNNYFSSS